MHEFTLYCLAVYKHDAPQCLIAGPWADQEEALFCLQALQPGHSNKLVLVETKMQFTLGE
jgi:hypothetical protein